jgi:hypothetical protein
MEFGEGGLLQEDREQFGGIGGDMFEEGQKADFDEFAAEEGQLIFPELLEVVLEQVETVEEVVGVELFPAEELRRSIRFGFHGLQSGVGLQFKDGVEQRPVGIEVVVVEDRGHLAQLLALSQHGGEGSVDLLLADVSFGMISGLLSDLDEGDYEFVQFEARLDVRLVEHAEGRSSQGSGGMCVAHEGVCEAGRDELR